MFHRHFSSRNEQRLANVLESGKIHATAGASRIKLAVSSSMMNEFWLQDAGRLRGGLRSHRLDHISCGTLHVGARVRG